MISPLLVLFFRPFGFRKKRRAGARVDNGNSLPDALSHILRPRLHRFPGIDKDVRLIDSHHIARLGFE